MENLIKEYPLIALFAFAGALVYGNFGLRQKHPNEVHLIWLAFSVLFSIALTLAILGWFKGQNLVAYCNSHFSYCEAIYKTLTDINEELKLVVVFAAVTIVPQILAYFLSGVWGTATAPQYAWLIRETAIWSFIKFLAGFGGILLAEALAKPLTGNFVAADFANAFNYTATAFVYAYWHTLFWDKWDYVYKKYFLEKGPKPWVVERMLDVHDVCTRNVPEKPPISLMRRAFIAVATSEWFYNLITRTRKAE